MDRDRATSAYQGRIFAIKMENASLVINLRTCPTLTKRLAPDGAFFGTYGSDTKATGQFLCDVGVD